MVSRLVFWGYAGSLLPWLTAVSASPISVSNWFLFGLVFPGLDSLFETGPSLFLAPLPMTPLGTTLYFAEERRSKSTGNPLRARRRASAGLLLLSGVVIFAVVFPRPIGAAPSYGPGPSRLWFWSAGLFVTLLTGLRMVNSAFESPKQAYKTPIGPSSPDKSNLE